MKVTYIVNGRERGLTLYGCEKIDDAVVERIKKDMYGGFMSIRNVKHKFIEVAPTWEGGLVARFDITSGKNVTRVHIFLDKE